MEFNQEANDEKVKEEEEGTSQDKAKQWFQDNLRIIISVLIVILIAGGIYSYSKRTQAPTVSQGTDVSEGTVADNAATPPADQTTNQTTPANGQTAANGATAQSNASSAATSQETDKSFIETAARGDSMTTLARKALADYLEKNPDSSLTVEHKIYIEDYLRKNVTQQKVAAGTSLEFSKDLIAQSITSAKTLSPKQLQNLHKYALRVPSLS